MTTSAEKAYSDLCDWKDHERWVPFTKVTIHSPQEFTAYTGVRPFVIKDRMRVTATNVEIAKALDWRSSYQNRHSDHLTYALLGDLLAQGKIVREEVVQSGRKQKSIVYRIALEETLTGPHS